MRVLAQQNLQSVLNAEVPPEKSCIFFGNISYAATDE
jgi:hypothetical protein